MARRCSLRAPTNLRPMLKEWLDANLPSMVRTLVEKEIRRLSQ